MNTPLAQAPLDEWLSYIEQVHQTPIELGLTRVKSVAQRLNIHFDAVTFVVGGTNGKGSTCAMLESILLAAGYKVGVYSSPHLLRFNERARINGEHAHNDAIRDKLVLVNQVRGDTSLSYFEWTMLAIFLLFMDAKLDAVVLEIGLGGRLDSVNIIDADCAIITNVDLDHMDWLGDNREAIGFEKAHIYRPNTPAICGDPIPPKALIEHAHAIGADLRCFGRDFNYSGDKQQWSFGGRALRRHALPYPSLRGANQLLNASGVLAALESVSDRLVVPQQAVRQGLLQVQLRGRFEILPGQPQVIFDVAHNPHAAAVLAQNLSSVGFARYTYAIFGMLSDKDIDGVIQHVKDQIDHWYCVDLGGARGTSARLLEEKLVQAGVLQDPEKSIKIFSDCSSAYMAARQNLSDDDRMIVFGSFMTVAGVMQHLGM